MRLRLPTLLAAAMVGLLTGCGGADDETPARPAPTRSAPPAAAPVIVRPNTNGGLYEAGNLAPAVDALRAEVGSGAQLLQVQLVPTRAQFQVRDGEGAIGFNWRAEDPGLREFGVRVQGGGDLDAQSFPLAVLDPATPQRLIAGARRRARTSRFLVSQMTLRVSPAEREARWAFSGRTAAGAVMLFSAAPDGTGLKRVA